MSLQWNGARIAAQVIDAAESGLFEAAEVLMDQAVEKTPVQDGILRGSAKASSDGLQAAVSFNTPYAVKQHEELGFNHPNGGEAKYLEKPANAFGPTLEAMVANAIRSETGL